MDLVHESDSQLLFWNLVKILELDRDLFEKKIEEKLFLNIMYVLEILTQVTVLLGLTLIME